MELIVDAGLGPMLLAAGLAVWCGLEARRSAPPRRSSVWLLLLALLAGANWLWLGRHPVQLVKTWDVQHAVLGAKYGRELGYFRLYECLVVFDAEGPRRWADLPEVSDLRAVRRRIPPARAIAGSDCRDRFTPARRAAFEADVAFFAGLPRQADPVTWFTDNGYNQSPFFTALLRPLLEAVPLSYGLLAALAWLDVLLLAAALAAVARCFGPTPGLLLALYFLTGFSSQFAVMGGSVLRYAYLALLLLFASGLRAGRPVPGGVALGLATLLQVFPAIYAIGLAIGAGWGIGAAWGWRRRAAGAAFPAWLAPGTRAFAATIGLGVLAGVVVAGPEAWPEFAAKMGIHGAQLSPYRVGLKLPFVLDWPPRPGGALDYAAALQQLAARFPLYLAAGGLLLGGVLALAPRMPAPGFAILFGSAALYVLTPVHYYFASLALLFLVDADAPGARAAASLGRALLFALSAGAFALWRWSDHALALVNGYALSPGIGLTLAILVLALFRSAGAPESGPAGAR